jgi:hypothetical protein
MIERFLTWVWADGLRFVGFVMLGITVVCFRVSEEGKKAVDN